jgi:methionine--tRNA ligase beta chain
VVPRTTRLAGGSSRHGRRASRLRRGARCFRRSTKTGREALLESLTPKIEGATATSTPTTTTTATPTPTPTSTSPRTPTPITYDQFSSVDLRVGVVRGCERVPKKDKLLKLAVDLGEGEPRTIVAGLALSFQPEQLVGRTVIVVANLAPRDFGKGLLSHGMLLATGASEALTLATVEGDVAPGTKVK